jgi:radical SAM protein with 4Fe4S-binding SPASM domain
MIASGSMHERSTDSSLENLRVEQHGGVFIASDPRTGALSALSAGEVVALHVYYALRLDPPRARRSTTAFLEQIGHSPGDAARFVDRLEREGWNRTAPPEPPEQPLIALYFTVTRRCNLACPYCYQGLAGRRDTGMSVGDAASYLDRVLSVNPHCQINITGGEPFTHPRIADILRLVSARGFPFVVLSNGTCIDDREIALLGELPGFRYLQLSVDGATAETHERTRGRGTFAKIMRTFDRAVRAGVPFVLAPTIHSRNIHELDELASLAIENGGWCSPNNLRVFPHEGLNFDEIELTPDQCLTAIRAMNATMLERFGMEHLAPLAEKYKTPSTCNTTVPNANFRCGVGYSLLDLDWNGDVYPCHLAKSPELVLGNLRDSDFETLFQRAAQRGIRVPSHRIPKCSQCTFVATCGGGCRAAAWFAYGSMSREDDQCDLHYRGALGRLLATRPELSGQSADAGCRVPGTRGFAPEPSTTGTRHPAAGTARNQVRAVDRDDPASIRLPEPEDVSPADADEWEQRLRGHAKPAIRERLRALDTIADPSDGDVVERLGLELRLQEIDRFLKALAVGANRAGWETYSSAPEVEETASGLHARIRLAYTPCNLYAVHGPFIALAILRVAAHCCAENERIAALESIRWSRPVVRNLSLDIADSAIAAFDTNTAAVHGSLRTTAGRRLLFRADDEANAYVTGQTNYNALTMAMLSGGTIAARGDEWRLPLAAVDAHRLRLLDDPAIATATLIDIAGVAVLKLRSGIPALSCGANGVVANVLADALRSEAPELRLRIDASHVSRSGLIVNTWAFRVDPVMSDWSTLVMAEAEDMQQMLRLLHLPSERNA